MDVLVKLIEATPRGRLYPAYDAGAGVLELTSRAAREWPHGVNIDGRVVFDLDADYLLANVEIVVPRQRWKVVSGFEGPEPRAAADLQFHRSTVARKSLSMALTIQTTADYSQVYVRFGKAGALVHRVELSERCSALVVDERRLVGFSVWL